MAFINEDKPDTATPETYLDIGDGHNLTIGGIYKLIIGALSTSGNFANVDKVSGGETWESITSTWAAETRTWLAASKLITNVTMSATDPLWSARTEPWQLTAPWQTTSTGVTNISKP